MASAGEGGKQGQPEAAQPSPREKFGQALGSVLFFLSHHPLYELQLLEDVRARVLPPVKLRQFRTVLLPNGNIAAYVSWAMLETATLKRLKEAVANGDSWNLPFGDDAWSAGTIPVIIDAVTAEPGTEEQVCRKVKGSIFKGTKLSAILPDPRTQIPALKLIG